MLTVFCGNASEARIAPGIRVENSVRRVKRGGVVMVLAYMGVVIRDAHNLEPRCDYCTGKSWSLCLRPRGGFVRMAASLPIIPSIGRETR